MSEHDQRERTERNYRNALREVGEIARQALAGHGSKRETALADISRLTARALQEGV